MLKPPDKRALEAHRTWFKLPVPALGGLAKRFLDDENDLVTLSSCEDIDYLSRVLRAYWPAKVRSDER